MDVGQKFNLLEHVTWLACLTMEATCTFDDVDDKIQEVDGLLDRLNVTRDELIECHRILRKVMNRAHDVKNELRQELLALAVSTAGSCSRSINGFALPSMHHKQLTSPIVSYLRYFRHRLVRYNWYIYIYICIKYIYIYTYREKERERERERETFLSEASTKDLKPF